MKKANLSRRKIGFFQSGWQDSNLRPRRPERRALPGCATPRKVAKLMGQFRAGIPILLGSWPEKAPDPKVGGSIVGQLNPRSEWQDSNLRPPAPHAGAIPGYATPRGNWSHKGRRKSEKTASACKFFASKSVFRAVGEVLELLPCRFLMSCRE